MKKKKDITKNMEEGFRETKNTLKKHIRITIATAFGLIVILMVAIITSQISFLVKEELIISVSPQNAYFLTFNNESFHANITIDTQRIGTCNAQCSFNITDLNSSTIIADGSFEDKHDIGIELRSPENGDGQRLYSVQIVCHNQKKLLCRTEEKPFYQSTLILNDYELRDNDKEIRRAFGQALPEIRSYAYNIDLLNKQNKMLLDLLDTNSEEKKVLKTQYVSSYESSREIMYFLDKQIIFWNNREYNKLETGIDYAYFLIELDTLQKSIRENITLRNDNIRMINSMISSREIISMMKRFFLNQSNDGNLLRLDNLNTVCKNMINHISATKINGKNSGKPYSESTLNKELNETTKELIRQIKEFSSIQQEIRSINEYYKDQLIILKNASVNYNSSGCTQLEEIRSDIKEWNSEVSAHLSSNASIMNSTGRDYSPINESSLNETIRKYCKDTTFTSIFRSDYIDLLTNYSEKIEIINESLPEVPVNLPILRDSDPECCVFGECLPCNTSIKPPVIFIHGHAFNEDTTPEASLNTFAKIQNRLQKDNIINAGQLYLTNNYQKGVLGKSNQQSTVRSTYYYISSYGLGSYSISIQKDERIENYAIRLKELIGELKYASGSDEVIVIAHSMGGLVLREYINLFGDESLNKSITINTPHHGVSGSVDKYCDLFGSEKECEDLSNESVFISRIKNAAVPDNFYSIRTIGCEMDFGEQGDGIVTNSSAYLEGAENILIQTECTGLGSLHSDVLDPDKYPVLYEELLRILRK